MDKFEKIRREQYPMTEKWAYLDTSTSGMIAKRTKDAMIAYIEDRFENGLDGAKLNENWAFGDGLRDTVAEMFHADSEEIFFGEAASTMINVFSSGVLLKENANVVTSGLTFPSTPYTWMNRVGVENVRIAQPVDGKMPPENLFALVDENTAVLSLCLVENTTGFRHDLKKISDFCQERGIYLVLDITQCVGAMEIDVKETPVDCFVTSSFKWLGGLFGIGFGYMSKRVMAQVPPVYVGWTGNKNRMDHSKYVLNLEDNARKYETGIPNWVGLKGIEQSMQQYLELGKKDVEAYILELVDELYAKVAEVPHLQVLGNFPKENRSGIVYINFPAEWEMSNAILKENGIRANVSGKAIRVALHYYNNRADIEKLIGFLREYKG
ncbi:MAG: aminotransferase class V-fold PLP-dependent enzyme [Bacillota bacterium]|nr:aminotransferase class V-fold PLP-dependent enzyme [Bacillota bacterium]